MNARPPRPHHLLERRWIPYRPRWPLCVLAVLFSFQPAVVPGRIFINEFLASNGSVYADSQGQFDDWIELYNDGAAPVDVGGMYVTDDLSRRTRHRIPTGFAAQTTIPAGGYLILWADNDTADGPLHLGFELSAGGEQIGLYQSDGATTVDATTYAPQVRDISFGRLPDGDPLVWRFFDPPSPGRMNVGGFQGRVADVAFGVRRGIYGAPFSVALSTPTPGAQIYYTTDSSDPTPSSTPYSGPIWVTGTKVVRARAYRSGWIPSDIVAHTYIFVNDVLTQPALPPGFPPQWIQGADNNYTMTGDYEVDPNVVNHPAYSDRVTSALTQIPSLSVSMHVDEWFDPATGIYSNSNLNDVPSWEKACSAELIYPDGRQGFSIRCGVRIAGQTSPINFKAPKLSMRLKFKDEYGPTRLGVNEPLFPGSRLRSFNTLVLDARLNNVWYHPDGTQRRRGLYLRDQFMNDMQNALGDPSPHGFYAHLYLNGLYWGVYCIHERPDDAFMADYWGGEPEDYDAVKHSPFDDRYILSGSNLEMQAMMNLANSGMANPTAYQQLTTQYLDLNAFINYDLLNFWGGNWDWGHKNYYLGRNRHDGSLFRFYSWDAEHVFEGANDDEVNSTGHMGGPRELHRELKDNPEYKIRFADRAHKLMKNGGLFTQGPATAMLDARAYEIDDAIIMESARWGDHRQDRNDPGIPLYTRDDWWTPELIRVRGLLASRADTVIGQMVAGQVYPTVPAPIYEIGGVAQHGGRISSGAVLTMRNPGGGGTIHYTLNGTDPRLPGGGISPLARNYTSDKPAPLIDTTWARARVLNGSVWSAMSDAVYQLDVADYRTLRITEVMYNPAAPAAASYWSNEDFEFIEIKNTGSHTLDLTGVSLDDGVYFTFHDSNIHNDAHVLAPGQHIVVVRNELAFRSRYGNAIHVAGRYWGSLDNAGERIRLVDGASSTILEFVYNNSREWPQAAGGAGHSFVPLGSALSGQTAGTGDYGGNWRRSTYIHGSPGADDPAAPASGPIGVVLNEIAAHTDHTPSPPDSNDWIELYNPTAGDIVLNNCYLSDGIRNLAKWQIPNGTVIRAGGFLSFDEINDFHNPVGFGLNKDGERAVLSYLPGTGGDRVLDEVRFKGQEKGVTLGRYSDGATASGPAVGSWRSMLPSRDAPNNPPLAAPVITQIMYHPDDGTTVSEYIEIHNPTGQAIDLWNAAGRWRISGGVRYEFATNVTLPAGGYLLILPFDPVDATALNAFKTKYGVTDFTSQVFGPYKGSLSNGGERLAVERPQAPDIPGEPRSWVIADETFYFDQSPFPASADGRGHALHRVSANAPGPDPTNWVAAPPDLMHSGVAPPLVANLPAGGVTHNAATLNGELTSTGGENPTVQIYWGTTDGGVNPAAWQNVEDLGVQGTGTFAAPVSGLTPATVYYYRAFAVNSAGGAWASAAANFTTANAPPSPPVVEHRPATDITYNSATLNGEVMYTGGENPQVRFYWGTTDGGKNGANWQSNRTMGFLAAGPFSTPIAGLSPNTLYFFQVYAENSGGTAWADASGTFRTADLPAVVPPAIATQAPTAVSHNAATLNGEVTDTGGENPTVRVYWGASAGGQVPDNWQHVQNLGTRAAGPVAASVFGLMPSTEHFYRFHAENSAGGTWAGATADFITNAPPLEPNLRVEQFDFTPQGFNAGDPIQLGGHIVNRGTATAVGPFWVEFRVSRNLDFSEPTFFLCDSLLIIVPLGPGEFFDLSTLSRTIYTPAQGLNDGAYVAGVKVDVLNDVPESNESDNSTWRPLKKLYIGLQPSRAGNWSLYR